MGVAHLWCRLFGPVPPIVIKSDEIVPGTQKPSIILADMVKLAIQQEPARVTKEYVPDPRWKADKFRGARPEFFNDKAVYTFEKGDKIKVKVSATRYFGAYMKEDHTTYQTQVWINGAPSNLTVAELRWVQQAMLDAWKMMENVRANNAEAERQRLCLESIESLVIGKPAPDLTALPDLVTAPGGEKRKRLPGGKTVAVAKPKLKREKAL